MLSRSSSKHSCIPGAYCRKHLLIPCPTNTIGRHILAIVSNKHMPASLDQGANWFGAPATNARRVSEANRIFNRTNPPIVAKIKDCENCTHAKFAQFSNNWQRFFPTHVCDTSCQSLTHAYRKLIKVGHSSRCSLTRSSQPRHMNSYSYVSVASCRAQMFPLCYES